MAKLHPMLSEMRFSILVMRWVFLSPQSPAGSGQDGGRSPRSPPGAPGAHLGALPRRGHGRGRAARPRPLRSSRKGLSVWSQAGWKSPSHNSLSAAPLPFSPSRHSPPPATGSALLLARRRRGTRTHRCARRGRAGDAPPTDTLSACAPLPARPGLPERPSRLREATIKPMPIMSPVHLRKGRSRPQLPRLGACLGLALWPPFTPTFTQMRMKVSICIYMCFPPSNLSSIPPLSRRGSSPVFARGAEGVQGDGGTRAHT